MSGMGAGASTRPPKYICVSGAGLVSTSPLARVLAGQEGWYWSDERCAETSDLFSGLHGTKTVVPKGGRLGSFPIRIELGETDQIVLPDIHLGHEEGRETLSIVVRSRAILTRHRNEIASLDRLFEGRARINYSKAKTTALVMAKILRIPLGPLELHLDALENQTRGIETRVLVNKEPPSTDELAIIRLELLNLRAGLRGVQRVIEALLDPSSGAYSELDEKEGEKDRYLQHLHDQIGRSLAAAQGIREAVETLESIAAAADSGESNLFVLRLTFLTAVALPGVLIAGILGMNVDFPGSGTEKGFYWAIGLMVISSSALFAYLLRQSKRSRQPLGKFWKDLTQG
ncbi:MAG: hypothetical protein KBF21_19140 [Thermoanaerobaculia bacterium]|nr:hypothetical protein [Thermoanaerobaculia bacterium]